jgi:hypothetical protein
MPNGPLPRHGDVDVEQQRDVLERALAVVDDLLPDLRDLPDAQPRGPPARYVAGGDGLPSCDKYALAVAWSVSSRLSALRRE